MSIHKLLSHDKASTIARKRGASGKNFSFEARLANSLPKRFQLEIQNEQMQERARAVSVQYGARSDPIGSKPNSVAGIISVPNRVVKQIPSMRRSRVTIADASGFFLIISIGGDQPDWLRTRDSSADSSTYGSQENSPVECNTSELYNPRLRTSGMVFVNSHLAGKGLSI
jgi:hypothetical protein